MYLTYIATLFAVFAANVEILVSGEGGLEMVAFTCNRPSMYQTVDGWIKDDTTDCLKDPEDILEYCRKIYPDLDVRNIVEASENVEIDNWCEFGQSQCHQKFTVRPFRCLVGPFQSDALLVPEHCVFDHVHDAKLCASYTEWNKTAIESCTGRHLAMQSFAILQPCGIDKFNGVEFVCCPHQPENQSTTSTVRPKTDPPATELPLPATSTAHQHQQQLQKQHVRGTVSETESDDSFTQYIRQGALGDGAVTAGGHRWNEHEYYAKARADMQKHHHEKIAKMMKEWSSARQRVQDLRSTDPASGDKLNKDITNKFQKMYETEEAEADTEKKQLAALHQQRVQAELDDRKRRMLDKYIEAIENDYDDEDADPVIVLRSLTGYIKVLQKDRLHTVNRYRHLRQTQSSEADAVRSQMVEHLLGIDRQMTAALGMLERLPTKTANKIKKQIEEYLDAYHAVDASILILFGPLETTTTPTTTPTTTTTTTTTTTPAPTTTSTTTTVAPIVDESDGSEDDEDDDEEDEEDDEDEVPAHESDEELQFKTAMKTKPVVVSEENSNSDDSNDDDYSYGSDTDRPLTVSPVTSSTVRSTSTPTPPSGTTGLDDGLFDDRGDSSEPSEQFDTVDYVHVQMPVAGHVNNLEKSASLVANQAYVQKRPVSGSDTFSAVPLGIAVGCITVCVVIIAGVVVMRRRGSARRRDVGGRAAAAGPGRLQLDPTASTEERHVAAMQMTGYENPTYKYFEAVTA